MLEALIDEGNQKLTRLKSAAADEVFKVEVTVLTGHPGRTIVDHAQTGGSDHIVTATHGRTASRTCRGKRRGKPYYEERRVRY
jgi:nucleotide-binding universal stress UspA family protein